VTKQDLVDALAKRLGVTKARAAEITELFFSDGGLLASELRRGGRVVVSGFGTFETRRRAAREGRNPRTGKPLSIKAATVPVFRAAKGLRELVNRKR
jgi:DNA-binding protein HU-beta